MNEFRRNTGPTLSAHGRLRPRSPSEALEPGRAPVRPRGNKRKRRMSRRVSGMVRFLSGILTMGLVGMAGLVAFSIVMFHQFEKPGPLEVTRTVSIPKGEGRIEIAQRLERDGVISNRWAFVASYLMRSGWQTRSGMDLKAGEYEIKKGASLQDVLDILIQGKSVLYKVTVPEGLTSEQIVARLTSNANLTGEITAVPAEGTLLPDTYSFSKDADRQDLLERMAAEQHKIVAGLWQEKQSDLPFSTPEEALILASLVEKETGRADERDRVAGVFVNRLRKGMRLQSDPTTIYGIAGGKGRLERPLTRADLASKTPYNTYQIKGLPPGPICNPGRSAIEATLNPAATKAIYFVADGTGGHTFSETLKAHNAAVAEWRKIEAKLRKQRALAAASPKPLSGDNAIPNPPTAEPGLDAVVAPIAETAAKKEGAVLKVVDSAQARVLKGLRASSVSVPIRRPKQ